MRIARSAFVPVVLSFCLSSLAYGVPQETHSASMATDPGQSRRLEALLRNLKDTGEVWSRELFDLLGDDLGLVRRNLMKLYPNHDPALLISRVESEVGGEFLPIFLHPGAARDWGNVLSLAGRLRRENPRARPYEVFKAAERAQGEVITFRGLVLLPEEMQGIRERGMLATGLLNDQAAAKVFKDFLDPDTVDPNLEEAYTDGAITRLLTLRGYNRKPGVQPGSRLIMSFTQYPIVARSVPYTDAIRAPYARFEELRQAARRGPVDPAELQAARDAMMEAQRNPLNPLGKRRLYVFKVRLPAWQVRYAKDYWQVDKYVQIGGERFSLKRDPQLEQYYPFAVPKDAILGVEEVSGPQPPYLMTN